MYKNWEYLSQDSLDLKKVFHDYKRYVDNTDIEEKISCLGFKYFIYDYSINEVAELFNLMLESGVGGQSIYGLLSYLFKTQLFNKRITIEEAKFIHKKYFGVPQRVCHPIKGFYMYDRFIDTEFIKKIFVYKIDTDDQETWDIFIQYLKDLKFSF